MSNIAKVRSMIKCDTIPDRFVIIGAGGIGSIVSRYLPILLSCSENMPEIVICDGDSFEPGNTYRMEVPDYANKADAIAMVIEEMGQPCVPISFPSHFTEENSSEVFGDGCVVFMCVDNHKTRCIVNEYANTLDNVVLISGGNDGIDEKNGEQGIMGNIQVMVRSDGEVVHGCPLDQFHDEIANPQDKHPGELSCQELAEAGVAQLVLANMTAATLMLNAYFRLLWTDDGIYDEAIFDIVENKVVPQWLTSRNQRKAR